MPHRLEQVKSKLHGWHERYGMRYIVGMTLAIIGGNIFLSSLIYLIAEDEVTNWFDSIYWTITTLSTVGYGDITPDSIIGKLVAMVNMLFGVALFPAFGALVVGFMNSMWQKKKDIENEHLAGQNAQIIKQNEIIIANQERIQAMLEQQLNGK